MGQANSISVYLVDDHQIMLDGIKALLADSDRYSVTGETTSSREALEHLRANAPDILITDIDMPELSGIELTREIKAAHPEIKVLALSMHGENAIITEMLDAGVSGYVLKNTGKEELINALDTVYRGNRFFSQEVAAEMIANINKIAKTKEAERKANLTPREREILKLIAEEQSNKAIAELLFISERTVETHRKHIFRKTQTKSIVGLIRYAIENGLID